jgi:hypothetical protein
VTKVKLLMQHASIAQPIEWRNGWIYEVGGRVEAWLTAVERLGLRAGTG